LISHTLFLHYACQEMNILEKLLRNECDSV
jgi:hypothetical protein